jgi:hypothetical protein
MWLLPCELSAPGTAVTMIRHIVLLKFTEEATVERRDRLCAAFAGLAEQIPQVRSLEWGLNVSPEGLDKGFTHCFALAFEDEAARDAYLPHPAHLAFVGDLKPWLADVLVIDYAVS